jgi:hypothetical protein
MEVPAYSNKHQAHQSKVQPTQKTKATAKGASRKYMLNSREERNDILKQSQHTQEEETKETAVSRNIHHPGSFTQVESEPYLTNSKQTT